MAVGPFSPPSGIFIPPSEATAEWRLLDAVGKQWVGLNPPKPLGAWARLRNNVHSGSPEVSLRAGTLVRVERVDSLHNAHIVVGELRTWVLARILDPAEPPRTWLERLLGPDDLG